jgi:quinol monooxygenase YgiN
MIIVKGAIPVKQEHLEEAVALLRELAEASRAERGCLAYEVFLSAEDPETVVLWQQWESEEALESHFASDHVDAFLDAIPDYVEGQVTSARFDVVADSLEDSEEALEPPRVQIADNIVIH